MADPFIGEVHMFGGNFAPLGWGFCNGQLMPISQNEALYNLLGTTYGGDGQSTFGIPDLRGRLPICQGAPPTGGNYVLGQLAGTETVTLITGQLAAHTHAISGSGDAAASRSPGGAVPAVSGRALYVKTGTTVPMAPGAVSSSGSTPGPHDNIMPFLCVNFIIAFEGIYPSQG